MASPETVVEAGAGPEASGGSCGTWSCLRRALRFSERPSVGPAGQLQRVIEGPQYRTEVTLTADGRIGEMVSFRRGFSEPVRRDLFTETGREKTLYPSAASDTSFQESWASAPSGGYSLWRGAPQGSGMADEVLGTSKVLQRDSCAIQAGFREFRVADLTRLTSHLVDGQAPDSADLMRFRTTGCDQHPGRAAFQRDLQGSLTQGLACMTQLGGRAALDAQNLYALVSHPQPGMNAACFSEVRQNRSGGREVIPGCPPGVLGLATMCGDTVAQGSQRPRFPGISINYSDSTRTPSQLKSTLFHEMLHTLGYPHGHAPDVSYVCEECCFPSRGSMNPQGDACRLCASPDPPGPEYYQLLTQSLRRESLRLPSDIGQLDFLSAPLDLAARGQASQMGAVIQAMLQGCPGGTLDGCLASGDGSDLDRLYQMLEAKKRAQALMPAGRGPGWTPADEALLSRMKREVGSTLVGGEVIAGMVGQVIAARMSGLSGAAAQRSVIDSINADCRRLGAALPPEDRGLVRGLLEDQASLIEMLGVPLASEQFARLCP